MKHLGVAKDFARYPAGRYRIDGPYNGERFREDFLKPMLINDSVEVNLDGTRGYGSSFLEEAFGGLIRSGQFTFTELENKLTIVSSKPSLTIEAWNYIKDAADLLSTQSH